MGVRFDKGLCNKLGNFCFLDRRGSLGTNRRIQYSGTVHMAGEVFLWIMFIEESSRWNEL